MQTDSSTRSCKNCGHSYSGLYCSSCGQKYIDKRITLKDSIHSVVDVIFNWERGMWYTIRVLIIKPSKVVQDYLNGITRPYIHPFRFLFLWVTIQVFFVVSSGMLDYSQSEIAQGMNEGMGVDQSQQSEFGILVQQKLKQYITLFLVMSIPFLAFFTKLFFRKKKYNFAEHLVLNSYAYGQSLVLSFLILPLYFIDHSWSFWIQVANFLISIAYMAYLYKSVFEGNVVVVFLKTIIVLVLWILGVVLVMSIAMIIFMFFMAISDPETLRQIKESSETALLMQ